MNRSRNAPSQFLSAWVVIFGSAALLAWPVAEAPDEEPIEAVPFTDVKVTDTFWSPRIETNRRTTLPSDFEKCEKTGRIANFARAGRLEEGPHEGHRYNDSDVFKVIEGAAYSLSLRPDHDLEVYVDSVVEKIASAQEDDGYLYTARTLGDISDTTGLERWSNLKDGHELYNVGHLYEAAVAYFQATGKRKLLNVALKNADLIASVFGPGRRQGVPGHEEIEIGLTKLYRVTKNHRYLDLAKFFLDQRGNADGHSLYGSYAQDDRPVCEQTRAVGHAVRAGYLYSGVADVATLTQNPNYIRTIDQIWHDVVSSKLYLTGGIGARHRGEAFGDQFELPNESAYNETCAAIANAMWNHRLFLLHGDSRYIDVLERILYNGFLSGVSLEGDTFFYPNPLASHGQHERSPWFKTACCPTNVVRFVPSFPGYALARRGRDIYVNLYFGGSGRIELPDQSVTLRQETSYPWTGQIRITVEVEKESSFGVLLRIPGWSLGRPVPSALYRYLSPSKGEIRITVNGEAVPIETELGYQPLRRTWRNGDRIALDLPMEIHRVLSDDRVSANIGRVALERGPIVYCAEHVDNGGQVHNLYLPDDAELAAEYRQALLGGITVLTGEVPALYPNRDQRKSRERRQSFTAIPYYAWAHRGPGEMEVWLPRIPELAKAVPETGRESER